MKITSKKTDDLNQILTVAVAAEDYAEIRRKKLAEYARAAEIPGFRKGKVPASLIEKMYGERVLGESVNNVVAEAIDKYIKEKKLDIIGEPLPVEEKEEHEWKAGNDFTFKFDMAMTPKVEVEVEKSDEIPFYTISSTEDEKKKYIEAFQKQDEKKPVEEIKKMVEENLKNEYKNAAEFRFGKDVRDFFVKKSGVQVPEKFLRRWLIAVNEGKLSAEEIDKDFQGFIDDYKWQLVLAALAKKFNVKIEKEDIENEAKAYARYQLMMYGMANADEKMLQGVTENILKDQNTVEHLVENLQNKKVVDAVKEAVTVKAKKISSEKFRELK